MAVAKVGRIEELRGDSPSPVEDQTDSSDQEGEVGLKLRLSNEYVKLNVGGSLFQTTVGTLCKRDGMLRAMFSGRMEIHKDEGGWVMIDRGGKHFSTVLNYLRDGSVPLPESQIECEELLVEARYFLLEDLSLMVSRHIAKMAHEEYLPRCRVPVITSPEEEHRIVSTSAKPVIKLLCNRSNNKYSYTSQSDDNLLKNLELFDKLAVRFAGRMKFVKDVVGRGEICQWSFYGLGKKVAEISCESIVYATEKKHTKIEFPEARILEEALNVMLYERPFENADRIRAARLEAASRRRHFEDFLSDFEDELSSSPPPPPPSARS